MFLSMLLSVTPLSAADAELVFDIDMPEHEKEIARELQASDHEFFLKVDEVCFNSVVIIVLQSWCGNFYSVKNREKCLQKM